MYFCMVFFSFILHLYYNILIIYIQVVLNFYFIYFLWLHQIPEDAGLHGSNPENCTESFRANCDVFVKWGQNRQVYVNLFVQKIVIDL